MIRNNLSILMSERGIKNSTLSMKTGISKNTISSTAQNDGKMIQLETINKICQVLNVTPSDFFSYVPYDVSFQLSLDDISVEYSTNDVYEVIDLSLKSLDLNLLIKVEKNNTFMDDYLFETTDFTKESIFTNNLFITLETTSESFSDFWETVPTPFASDITARISKEVKKHVLDSLSTEISGMNYSYEDDLINRIESIIVETIAFQLSMPF